MSVRYVLFETALGPCGLAWTAGGVTAVQLPEATPHATAAKLEARGAAPAALDDAPAWVRDLTAALARHVGGDAQDLAGVPLSMDDLTPFRRRVYEAARAVPAGRAVTYGELAERVGRAGASRAVGQCMARNPFPIVVPCHRVLAAGDRPGGFSAYGAQATKARLLAAEGVALPGAPASLFRGASGAAYDREAAVKALARADRALARLIARVGPCRLEVEGLASPFASLAEAIVHQQLTGKAAATIAARVKALGGGAYPAPEALLALPEASLRAAGLSTAKAAALRDLAARVLDGTVPALDALRAMDDDAIVERLTRVRGVGRWTVEMLLIFRLGRPDVLPTTDYGVRKGFARTFRTKDLPTPTAVAARGERWQPYRSVASWYLWRALEA